MNKLEKIANKLAYNLGVLSAEIEGFIKPKINWIFPFAIGMANRKLNENDVTDKGKQNLRSDGNFNIITIENPEDFMKWAPSVWEMLSLSYEGVGGLKSYRNYNNFCRKEHLMLLALEENSGELLACATYRDIEESRKMVAIGCNQSRIGKEALKSIIQHNIENFDLRYWAEVSGRIEYYFKKHNGYPMPNAFASEILNIDESKITPSQLDKIHYTRKIGVDGEEFEKMIFGAKSDEIYQRALKEIEHYGSFMQEVNNLNENIASGKYTVKQAIYIIENIYRAHEEDGFNELIPSWNQGLIDCLDTLKRCEEKNRTVIMYIKYCEYLLDDMQLLELHPLKLW